MSQQQTEAGPSTPRMPTTPATVKAKRRSWFSFGGGGSSSTPSAQAAGPRRPSNGHQSSVQDEEVELDLRGNGPRESNASGPIFGDTRDGEEIGGTNGNEMGLGIGRTGENDEELLTIDGDPETTVKKKKKKRLKSSEQQDGEGETVRLEDMSGRRSSVKSTDGLTEEEGSPTLGRRELPRRTTSRRASDRSLRARLSNDTAVEAHHPPPPPLPSIPAYPTIPHRTSSSSQHTAPSPTIPIIYADTDKPQPPPPLPLDRPLPPLPPASGETVPEVPHGIVVIPSSPRKLVETQRSISASAAVRGSQRSRSASRSRDSSRSRNGQSGRNSPIGLGLPASLTGTSDDDPPPLPSKPQSVSSPHPSRSTSPAPKISFAEPQGSQDVRDARDRPDQAGQDKKTRVKRARSLSGIFSGRSAAAVGTSKPDNEQRPMENGGEEVLVDDAPGGTKPHGVLEWLGVKKVVKRRQSENKLRSAAAESVDNNSAQDTAVAPPVPPLPRPGAGPAETSREDPVLDSDPAASSSTVELGSQRPDLRSEEPTTTVVPQPGKLSSLFARRASSKGGQSDTEGGDGASPALPPTQAQPIPNANRRQQSNAASSSSSSFTLPPVAGPVSPGFFQPNAPWMSSPTSEAEEMLFSPPSGATWGPGIRPWMDGTTSPHGTSRSPASSPLSTMPEGGVVDLKPPPPVTSRVPSEGRIRSYSDAPAPSAGLQPSGSATRLATPSSGSQSVQTSPLFGPRPTLGSRSSSGNSAIIGRMKTVFSKSTSRSRSKSLLPQPSTNASASSDVDDFGGVRGRTMPSSSTRMRPSSSSSSMTSHGPATSRMPFGGVGGPNASLLELVAGERQVGHTDHHQRSPRTSFSGTMSSYATASTRQSVGGESGRDHHHHASDKDRRTRARASTVSFAPSISQAPTPSSPGLFPVSATPPRHRPGAIHRLSSGLFGSGASSPKGGGSLFPLPPRSSGSISSSVTGFGPQDDTTSGLLSPGTSPRPSVGSISGAVGGPSKHVVAREGEETSEIWLERITRTVGRNDIAGVLAASGNEFHIEALKLYMSRFDFTHNALDVALRRLLLQMSLPRETQQIDRVIEAFANRYEQCEPGLFEQKDNTYVLAFSMMMLHTDAFNKHNKNKMTKSDYVRNTRLDGVPPIVLEAFFDNITFTPFVFIEDDADLRRASGHESATSQLGSSPLASGLSTPGLGIGTTSKSSKIDVYHMIVRGLLPTLRVDVESHIAAESPFSCLGTRPFLDMDGLHRAFVTARSLHIDAPSHKKKGSAVLSDKLSASKGDAAAAGGEMVLKITKVGLLSRKDESGDASKKASRKWRSWSVILTGSQLLFFKDPIWALTLLEQARSASEDAAGNRPLPRVTSFKPDEVFPVKDCIAIYDRGLTKTPNAFRFIMPHQRQYLMQASDEYEMNEWITLINYASAFKTAGIRMRASTMDKDKAVLAGAAAAASHKREVQGTAMTHGSGTSTPKKAVFGEPAGEFGDRLAAELGAPTGSRTDSGTVAAPSTSTLTSTTAPAVVARKGAVLDVAGANEVALEDGERLEEVFDVVKAELAAGRGGAMRRASPERAHRADGKSSHRAHASRAEAIDAQIRHFEAKAAPLERQLIEHLRHARNLAILTPFQKTTRERIAAAVPPLARRIHSDRLHLAKLRLWITVLRKDAERDTREWARVRHVALQAAAKSLRDPAGVRAVVEDVNNGSGMAVPKLSLPPTGSDHEHENDDRHQHGHEQNTAYRQENGRKERSGSGSGSHSPEEDSPIDSVRLAASPVELPVMIRRSSDELNPPPFTRPTFSRHTSAGSLRSHSTTSRTSDLPPREGMKRSASASDYLTVGMGMGTRRGSRNGPDGEEDWVDDSPGLGPMVVFPSSDAEEGEEGGEGEGITSHEGDRLGSSDIREEERGDYKTGEGMRGSIEKVSKTTNGSDTDADRGEDSGATGTGGPAGPGSAGSAGSAGEAKGPGGEHEDEKAEEWQNTKAARRVSLAKLGLSQNEMRSLSARIKKEEGKEKVEGEGEGEKLELATRKRGEDSGEVMDRKA